MLQKEIKSVEINVVENKLQKFISQAFSANSQKHAIVMAIWGAILGGASPYILMWQQGETLPSWQTVVVGTIVGAFGVWSGYSGKNGALGNSGTGAVIKSQPNQ